MSHIWSFESASRLRATYGLLKVPVGYEIHLVFDIGTIQGIKRKYSKGHFIDNTFKENLIDNIPRIEGKYVKWNFTNNIS